MCPRATMEHGGIEHATQLCLLPAAFMLLGSCLVFVLVVPTKVMAAMQHLAAGIVSSAVAVEMMPIVMGEPAGRSNTPNPASPLRAAASPGPASACPFGGSTDTREWPGLLRLSLASVLP